MDIKITIYHYCTGVQGASNFQGKTGKTGRFLTERAEVEEGPRVLTERTEERRGKSKVLTERHREDQGHGGGSPGRFKFSGSAGFSPMWLGERYWR
jgi:hypothetical protein